MKAWTKDQHKGNSPIDSAGETVDGADGDLACVLETLSLIGFGKLAFSCGFSSTQRDTIMEPVGAILASLDWGHLLLPQPSQVVGIQRNCERSPSSPIHLPSRGFEMCLEPVLKPGLPAPAFWPQFRW